MLDFDPKDIDDMGDDAGDEPEPPPIGRWTATSSHDVYMVDAPSGGASEQAPRWDLVDTEGCGAGIRFLAPYLIVWGYVGIYRRKEYVGGAAGGPRGRGACPRGVRPPPS